MRFFRACFALLMLLGAVLAIAPASDALPIFAQRYGGKPPPLPRSVPAPHRAGEAFAANGFRRHGEEPR